MTPSIPATCGGAVRLALLAGLALLVTGCSGKEESAGGAANSDGSMSSQDAAAPTGMNGTGGVAPGAGGGTSTSSGGIGNLTGSAGATSHDAGFARAADANASGPGDGSGSPRADAAVSDPGCSPSLARQACSGDRSCRFTEACMTGQCVCLAGSWVCSRRDTCSATCGVPQESVCGASCDTPAQGCLCSPSGHGPNYVGCHCSSGTWDCSSSAP